MTLTAADKMSGVRSIAWRVNGGTADPVRRPGRRRQRHPACSSTGRRQGRHQGGVEDDHAQDRHEAARHRHAAGRQGRRSPPAPGAAPSASPRSHAMPRPAWPTKNVRHRRRRRRRRWAPTIVVKGDGAHTIAVRAEDKAGNRHHDHSTLVIDTTAPGHRAVPRAAGDDRARRCTPNGDGSRRGGHAPLLRLGGRAASRPSSPTPRRHVVRTITAPVAAGANALEWDGRTAAGKPVPDGRYTRHAHAARPRGQHRQARPRRGRRLRRPGAPYPTPKVVLPPGRGHARPEDDAPPSRSCAGHASPSGSSTQTAPSSAPGMTDKALPAGPATWAWNGKNDAGAFAPRGAYRIVVAATNGTQRAAQRAPRPRGGVPPHDVASPSAVRGKALTVTAVTAEGLSTAPRSRGPPAGPGSLDGSDDEAELHDLDRRRHAQEGRRGRHADPGRQGDRRQGRRQLRARSGWSSSSARPRGPGRRSRSIGPTASCNGGLASCVDNGGVNSSFPGWGVPEGPTVAMRTARGPQPATAHGDPAPADRRP